MTARDDLTRVLDATDEVGASITRIEWEQAAATHPEHVAVHVSTLREFRALAAALGVKVRDGYTGRWSHRSECRSYGALSKDNRLLIEHHCFPWQAECVEVGESR